MTKAAYFALPNPERYAAAQAILKGRVCLYAHRQDIKGFNSYCEYLREFGVNTYRVEYERQFEERQYTFYPCFIEADNIENLPEGFDIILNHEFESKALIFEPTN